MVSSISKFAAAIEQAESRHSASGEKITKAEVANAIETITANGKVSRAELKAARDVLSSATLTPAAAGVLRSFIENHEVTSEDKLSAATCVAILARFKAAEGRGKITWKAALPIGERFHTQALKGSKHPDGYSFSALVPQGRVGGRLRPLSEATHCFIARSGGLAGKTMYAGPFEMPPRARTILDVRVTDDRHGAGGLDSGTIGRRWGAGGSDSYGSGFGGGGGGNPS